MCNAASRATGSTTGTTGSAASRATGSTTGTTGSATRTTGSAASTTGWTRYPANDVISEFDVEGHQVWLHSLLSK
jgi:hypothetical protein